jgi:hypothetical protein
MHAIIFTSASIFLALGIPLAFVPMMPALWYMMAISLAFGLYDGFVSITALNFGFLLAVLATSVIIDALSGVLGAKYGGAHTKSIFWGIGGAIVGTFVLPVFGSLIGLFVAVFCAELYYLRTRSHALKAASSALVGAVVGVVVNVFLAALFFALFVVFALS